MATSRLKLPVTRMPVKDKTIESVGYDPTRNILEVEFKAGGVYQYNEVAPKIYDDLMKAGSKTAFFDERIRSRWVCDRYNRCYPKPGEAEEDDEQDSGGGDKKT